jgi:hypothetical protein
VAGSHPNPGFAVCPGVNRPALGDNRLPVETYTEAAFNSSQHVLDGFFLQVPQTNRT